MSSARPKFKVYKGFNIYIAKEEGEVYLKDQKGITMITLVIAITIIVIIAAVVTYSGTESVNSSKRMAFISKLEMIQAKVNVIYEERKTSIEKLNYYNSIGKDISNVDSDKLVEVLGETNKQGFRYFKPSDLKKLDLDNINEAVLINFDTREVISLNGFEIDGTRYYKLKDIPGYIGYNIDYTNSNTQAPSFMVTQTKLNDNEYRFSIKDIVYNSNVSGGTVSYKLHNKTNWILNGTNTSFTVIQPGLYDVRFTDNAGNSTTVQKWIYVENGLVCYLDGENNTGNGHDNTATLWKDLSGNGNDATLIATIWNENNVKLDGSTSYGVIKEMNYENITIEAVAEYDAIENGEMNLISNEDNGGYAIQKSIASNQNGVNVNIEGNYFYTKSTENITINKKYHLAGTYDNEKVNFFENLNKNETEKKGKITIPQSNTVMAIGGNPSGDNVNSGFFNGKIYAIRIYNRALTDKEIKTNFEIDQYRFGITE